MQNAGFLLTAFVVVWVVLFGYVLYLMKKQKDLQKEINLMKEALKAKK